MCHLLLSIPKYNKFYTENSTVSIVKPKVKQRLINLFIKEIMRGGSES